MGLLPISGHDAWRKELARAAAAGRLPQVLLVTGAAGVGKQRLALWLAQLLFCERPGAEPCGACPGCRQVLGLVHPDLHWFVPVPRPKTGEPDKQVDEVAQLLEGVMAERRETGIWSAPDGMSVHGVAAARLLQRHASMTSVAGGWRVFVIGHAERLVPQASSPEAANALLKLLEEPPARSLFVLTATEPGLLLDTIRSRATPIRLGRLSDDEVRTFLHTVRPELASDETIARVRGSIGAALDGDTEEMARARSAAREFAEAVSHGERATMERVLRQPPWQARGDFTAMLDALSERLSARLRRAAGGALRVSPEDMAALATAADRVLAVRQRAQGNVNPQLLLAALADQLGAREAE